MSEISDLKPALIWKYFDEILQVPRPSKKEEKIIKFLEDFASEKKLHIKKDKAGNILISKPATEGFENLQTLVLQSHIDMVCEKNSNITHDFTNDPINAYIEDGWIKAKGTTLGADNGIGIAAQLAVLSSMDINHGPIECLFTVDEETGLTGANNLGKDFFAGKTLINLDSEDDGEIFIGCAGGVDTVINLKYKTKKPSKNFKAYTISISGLKGGHSGDDINKGLANSNKLLTRLLWRLKKKFDIELADFQGGNLRNAIPREAFATIAVKKDTTEKINKFIDDFTQLIKAEYEPTDPDIMINLQKSKLPKKVLKNKYTDRLLNSLFACPNGVISMSQSVPDLVETSSNLASVHFTEKNRIEIVTSQRSSVESSKHSIAQGIESNFLLAKGKVTHTDSYPGWTPNTNSAILKIATKEYRKLFKKDAKVRAIHAGLECGLFLEKYPDLDMISIGPTLKGVHSPDEKMEIITVERFWDFLVKILENIPKN